MSARRVVFDVEPMESYQQNPDGFLDLGMLDQASPGGTFTCPNCGYSGPQSEYLQNTAAHNATPAGDQMEELPDGCPCEAPLPTSSGPDRRDQVECACGLAETFPNIPPPRQPPQDPCTCNVGTPPPGRAALDFFLGPPENIPCTPCAPCSPCARPLGASTPKSPSIDPANITWRSLDWFTLPYEGSISTAPQEIPRGASTPHPYSHISSESSPSNMTEITQPSYGRSPHSQISRTSPPPGMPSTSCGRASCPGSQQESYNRTRSASPPSQMASPAPCGLSATSPPNDRFRTPTPLRGMRPPPDDLLWPSPDNQNAASRPESYNRTRSASPSSQMASPASCGLAATSPPNYSRSTPTPQREICPAADNSFWASPDDFNRAIRPDSYSRTRSASPPSHMASPAPCGSAATSPPNDRFRTPTPLRGMRPPADDPLWPSPENPSAASKPESYNRSRSASPPCHVASPAPCGLAATSPANDPFRTPTPLRGMRPPPDDLLWPSPDEPNAASRPESFNRSRSPSPPSHMTPSPQTQTSRFSPPAGMPRTHCPGASCAGLMPGTPYPYGVSPTPGQGLRSTSPPSHMVQNSSPQVLNKSNSLYLSCEPSDTTIRAGPSAGMSTPPSQDRPIASSSPLNTAKKVSKAMESLEFSEVERIKKRLKEYQNCRREEVVNKGL